MNAYHIWYANMNLEVEYELIWCNGDDYKSAMKAKGIEWHSILLAQFAG